MSIDDGYEHLALSVNETNPYIHDVIKRVSADCTFRDLLLPLRFPDLH